MKPAQVFRCLLSQGGQSMVSREWHMSVRAMLGISAGLEQEFEREVETLAETDLRLKQYLERYTPEEIAAHMRYLQGIK